MKKRGFDIPLLTDIIKKLAAGEPLPEKNRDHQLSGDYAGCRFVTLLDRSLIYEADGDEAPDFILLGGWDRITIHFRGQLDL